MTDDTYTKPLPDLDDAEMAPYWEATRQHRLTAQRCDSCGTLRYPALPICDHCLHEGSTWVDVSQQGTVWSYVVYHRAFHPSFQDDLPYVVLMVVNDDGLRFTSLLDGPREGLAVGSPVEAVFADETPRFTALKWRLGRAG